jgi:hypothetical protein
LEARQNFKFKPSSVLVPVGSCYFLQRLWNVRFLGCKNVGDGKAAIAVLKFFCRVKVGLAQKPNLVKQFHSVKCSIFVVLVIWYRSESFCLACLFARLCITLLDFVVNFSCFDDDFDLDSGRGFLLWFWFGCRLGI